jgi:hypothetical protein
MRVAPAPNIIPTKPNTILARTVLGATEAEREPAPNPPPPPNGAYDVVGTPSPVPPPVKLAPLGYEIKGNREDAGQQLVRKGRENEMHATHSNRPCLIIKLARRSVLAQTLPTNRVPERSITIRR